MALVSENKMCCCNLESGILAGAIVSIVVAFFNLIGHGWFIYLGVVFTLIAGIAGLCAALMRKKANPKIPLLGAILVFISAAIEAIVVIMSFVDFFRWDDLIMRDTALNDKLKTRVLVTGCLMLCGALWLAYYGWALLIFKKKLENSPHSEERVIKVMGIEKVEKNKGEDVYKPN